MTAYLDAAPEPTITLCVGGFDPTPDQAEHRPHGLGFYQWQDGAATLVKTLDLEQPTWFTWSEKHRMLYVSHSARTWLSAVSIPGGPETAEVVDAIDIACVNPAHISLDPNEQAVIAACFTGGEVIGVELASDGHFAGVRSKIAVAGLAETALRRHVFQSEAEPHQSVFVAGGTRCLVADRAQDAVHTFSYTGPGQLAHEASLVLRPGSGPRHIALHPNLPLAYVACELDSTLVTAHLAQDGIEPRRVQTTLPDGFFGDNAVSAIAVSPDGARLTVSNRGHDSVAVYNIADDPERPSLDGWIPARGTTPRFAGFLPPAGAFAIAAMGSDAVHLFDGDAASLAAAVQGTPPLATLQHAAPACVLAVQLEAQPKQAS